jgi:hypothetical protein
VEAELITGAEAGEQTWIPGFGRRRGSRHGGTGR